MFQQIPSCAIRSSHNGDSVQVPVSDGRRLGISRIVPLVPGFDSSRSNLMGSHGHDAKIELLSAEGCRL